MLAWHHASKRVKRNKSHAQCTLQGRVLISRIVLISPLGGKKSPIVPPWQGWSGHCRVSSNCVGWLARMFQLSSHQTRRRASKLLEEPTFIYYGDDQGRGRLLEKELLKGPGGGFMHLGINLKYPTFIGGQNDSAKRRIPKICSWWSL